MADEVVAERHGPFDAAPASLHAIPPGVQPIIAPVIYASSIQFMRAGPDGTLILSQPRPVTVSQDSGVVLAAMNEAVAIVHLSAATMKDLYLVLRDAITDYESNYGTIDTEFSRKKAGSV